MNLKTKWGIALFAILLLALPTLLTAKVPVPEIIKPKFEFEGAFAITGLLAIAYLVLRQK